MAPPGHMMEGYRKSLKEFKLQDYGRVFGSYSCWY